MLVRPMNNSARWRRCRETVDGIRALTRISAFAFTAAAATVIATLSNDLNRDAYRASKDVLPGGWRASS